MYLASESRSPRIKEIIMDPVPQPKPLITTISSGSLSEIILVKLFSNPQHIQESSIKSDPKESVRQAVSPTEIIILAKDTRPTAIHNRMDINSLKTIKAMTEVAAISKLFSNEAFAAEVMDKPIIWKIEAAMSSITMPTV